MTASQYQAAKGVHQPWAMEISPVQYARMGKSAKRAYDAKRAAEWDASAECKRQYEREVLAAFDAGAFSLSDPTVLQDAARVVRRALADREIARVEAEREQALEDNMLVIADLAVGMRVYCLVGGRYADVVKVNRKSAIVRFDGGREYKVRDGFVTRRAPRELY